MRAKHASSGWLLDTASRIVERAHAAGASVIVNDRADIARLSGADGVHLGQDDLRPAAARAILGDAGADHRRPVHAHASSRWTPRSPQPISYLRDRPRVRHRDQGHRVRRGRPASACGTRRARARHAELPLVAIGGITLDTAPAVIEAGAASVAVISDLLAGNDPERRVRAYLERISR